MRCHLRPLLSVYVDLPVIRISVSFANGAQPFFEIAYVLVRFDRISRFIALS